MRTFGQPMHTWRTLMPPDMLLRSDWEHTNLSGPSGAGTLDHWVAETGEPRLEPTPLQSFLRYGDWFRERFVPDTDPADVTLLESANGSFRVTTSAGAEIEARDVVLAVGVTPFARLPRAFQAFAGDPRVAFAIESQSFECYRDQRVAIIGGGQNGLESAVMARRAEAASVEVFVRSNVRWYASREPYAARSALRARLYRMAYPIVGFGPPPINRIVLHPDLFSHLPMRVRTRLNARLLRAGGAPWIRPEVEGVIPVHERCVVRSAEERDGALLLGLSDGTTREFDRVIVATGYQFDLERLAFLAPEVRASIAVRNGWPVLDRNLRSTNPRILFAGYAAEGQYGPLARFVEGTRFAARRCAAALL